MSNKRTNSETQPEKIEDVAMIDSKVKEMANQIFQQNKDKYQDINKLIEEAFTNGVREILATRKELEKVEQSSLVEDKFKYSSWQLNLYPKNQKDAAWAEIKSNILLQGLKQYKME